MENNMKTTLGFDVIGFLKIYDPNSGYVYVDKHNAINYENMSESMALTLSNRGYGYIYQMAFGNGGASVDSTGLITYLPPNTTGQNAALYNQTYQKIVDDTLISNFSPTTNKMIVSHVSGKVYTDILVQCLLDYGEPAGQDAFDNGTNTDGNYVFDELGLLANYGPDITGAPTTKLLTHVIFHPIQKALNIQIQIDYTIRIQAITNLVNL
jgi:hypothetical protein